MPIHQRLMFRLLWSVKHFGSLAMSRHAFTEPRLHAPILAKWSRMVSLAPCAFNISALITFRAHRRWSVLLYGALGNHAEMVRLRLRVGWVSRAAAQQQMR